MHSLPADDGTSPIDDEVDVSHSEAEESGLNVTKAATKSKFSNQNGNGSAGENQNSEESAEKLK